MVFVEVTLVSQEGLTVTLDRGASDLYLLIEKTAACLGRGRREDIVATGSALVDELT